MHRAPNQSEAAARGRWLAELSAAIDQAQTLAWRMSSERSSTEALELYERLEMLRAEVDAIRRSGWATMRDGISSEWIDLLPESLKKLDPARGNRASGPFR